MLNFLIPKAQAATYNLDKFGPMGMTVAGEPRAFWGNVVSIAFVVAIILAFGYMVYGGISWITASGDPGKIETASKRMIWAAVGLVVLGSLWAIFRLLLMTVFGSADIELPTIN